MQDSENVVRIKREAISIASQTGGAIGSEHILAGIVMIGNSIASKILQFHGVTFERIQNNFRMENLKTEPFYTERSKRIFQNSEGFALDCNSSVVCSEHLLAAILSEKESFGYDIITKTVDNIISLENDIIGELKAQKRNNMGCEVKMSSENFGMNGPQNDEKLSEGLNIKDDTIFFRRSAPEKSGLLKELNGFGVDLTEKAKEGKLDPVIGRDKEIERIIQILCRRTKNNPVLIGEPGVGKSAVSEGLALAIVNNTVPEELQGKKIFSLDLASIVAGTKYRGEFEERFKTALDAVKKAGDIILFIDEIHTIVNAGGAEGAVDAGNILKPMLARGELQTIGATTIEEYRKYIEKDAALERRFQPVVVDQPTVEDTILILKGLRDKYEKHHKVKILDSAIEASATLSDRYIIDRFLPDKAIDLVDEAASRKRIYNKDKEVTELSIGEDEIAEIVADWTGIPVSKLTEVEGQRLLKLEDTLHERVIGQNEAVSAVARAIKRARAGIADPRRPIGSFIFMGPTGVGKTELCKALAEAMFGDENLMIRVDMSEYMDKANVSKLIGSAPGLVGFDEGGQLTEKVRRKPYSVVLFDEIEKAHPDVFNMLLQILEDGRLTDSHGRTISFKNTIIIMTSNVGASELKATPKLGFGNDDDEYDDVRDRQIEALKGVMKPEFINRIDEIVLFTPLDKTDIEKIANIMLQNLAKRLMDKNIRLNVDRFAKDYLVDKGYDKEYGARPMRRTIQRQVEDRLSEEILMGKIKSNSTVTITCVDGELTFEKE